MQRYFPIFAALALLSSCKSDHPAAPQEIQLPASIAFMHSKNAENEQDLYLLDSKGNEHPLVVVDGDHRRPSRAPNGLRIAFASVRGYASEIYLVNPDGTNERNITNNPAWDERPVWSPDGHTIVFESTRANGHDLFVMDSSGLNALPLTANQGVNTEPSWSPDGRHVVFVSNRDGNHELYVADAQTGEQQNLTNTPAVEEEAPSWSPEANIIAFVAQSQLVLINSDGTDRRQVGQIQDSLDVYPPAWSPDGQKLVTVTMTGQLLLMDLATEQVRSLLPSGLLAAWPQWSPDGKMVAFQAKSASVSQIYVVRPDGSGLLQLTQGTETNWFPKWSPRPG